MIFMDRGICLFDLRYLDLIKYQCGLQLVQFGDKLGIGLFTFFTEARAVKSVFCIRNGIFRDVGKDWFGLGRFFL